MTTERVYALIRLAGGDYLLPSNDGRALYRVYRYEEDGTLSYVGGDGRERTVRGRFWAYAKPRRPIDLDPAAIAALPDDFLDWGEWVTWATGYRTRAAAIADALVER